MTKGQRAGDAPIGVNVLEGKTYYLSLINI